MPTEGGADKTVLYLFQARCGPCLWRLVIGTTYGPESGRTSVYPEDHTKVSEYCSETPDEYRLDRQYHGFRGWDLEGVLRAWIKHRIKVDPRSRCNVKHIVRGDTTHGSSGIGSPESLMLKTEEFPFDTLTAVLDHAVYDLYNNPTITLDDTVRNIVNEIWVTRSPFILSLYSPQENEFRQHWIFRGVWCEEHPFWTELRSVPTSAVLAKIEANSVDPVSDIRQFLGGSVDLILALNKSKRAEVVAWMKTELGHVLPKPKKKPKPKYKECPTCHRSMGLKGTASEIPGYPLELYPSDYEGSDAGIAISAYGDWLAIGAEEEGAVFVYHRVLDSSGDDTWVLHQTIAYPGSDTSNKFGNDLSVYESHLAIGSYWENGGCIRFYELMDDSWTYKQKICEARGYMGSFFAIHENTVLIGGQYKAWYSQYSGGVWEALTELSKPTTYSSLSTFSRVALGERWAAVISDDELYIYDTDEAEWRFGPVFVYHHGWTNGDNTYPGEVAVDGDRVVICNGHSDAKEMIVLSYDGSQWAEEQTWEGEAIYRVALMGETLVSSTVDRVRVYDRDIDSGLWSEMYSLTPVLNGRYPSLDLTSHGLFLGAPHLNHDGDTHVGGAYVYPAAAICADLDTVTTAAGLPWVSAPVGREVQAAVSLFTDGGDSIRSTMSVSAEWESEACECEAGADGSFSCPMTFASAETTEYSVFATCSTGQRVDLGTGSVNVYVPEYSVAGTQALYTSEGGLAVTVPSAVTTDSNATIVFRVYDASSNQIFNPLASLRFVAAIYGPLSSTTPVWSGPALWSEDNSAYIIGSSASSIQPTSPGAYSVVVTETSSPSEEVTLTFTVGAGVPSAEQSSLSAVSATVGGSVDLVLTLLDARGNDCGSGVTAHITLDTPDATAPGVSHTDSVGYETTLALGTESGPHTVYAALTGAVPDDTVLSFPFYIEPGPPVALEVTGSTYVTSVDASSQLLVVFSVLDTYGNALYPDASTYLYLTVDGEAAKVLCTRVNGKLEVSLPTNTLAGGSHGVTVVWGEAGSLTGTVDVTAALSEEHSSVQMNPESPKMMSQASLYVTLRDTSGTQYPSTLTVYAQYEDTLSTCRYEVGVRAYLCQMTFLDIDTTSYKVLVAPTSDATPVDFMTAPVVVAAGAYNPSQTQMYYLHNSVDTYPGVATADDPFSLVIKVFDQSGNRITSNPIGTSLTVSVRQDVTSFDDVWAGSTTWSETEGGFMTGLMSISDLDTVGSTFKVYATDADGSSVVGDLTVIPGVPHMATSVVSSLDGPAGSTVSVTVLPKDASSNTLVDLTAQMAYDTPDPSAPTVAYTYGVGYTTALTLPDDTGVHTLVVSLAGGSLSDSVDLEYPLFVTSGAPSTVNVLNHFLVEDMDAVVSFTVADSVGNALTEDLDAVVYLRDSGFDTNTQCTKVAGLDGSWIYSGSVSFGSTPLMGTHEIVALLADGSNCTGQLVVSSLMSGAQSSVEPAILDLVAGERAGVKVVTSDSAGDLYTSEVVVTVHAEDTQYPCGYVSDGADSFYSCNISATLVSTTSYEEAFSVVYDTVTTVPSSIVAGDTFVAHLEVFDAFGNAIQTEPTGVSVSASVRTEAEPDEVVVYAAAKWDSDLHAYVTDATAPLSLDSQGDYLCVFAITNQVSASLSGDVSLHLSVASAPASEDMSFLPGVPMATLTLGAGCAVGGMILMGGCCLGCCCCMRKKRTESAKLSRNDSAAITQVVSSDASPAVMITPDLESQTLPRAPLPMASLATMTPRTVMPHNMPPDVGAVTLSIPSDVIAADTASLLAREDVIPLDQLTMVRELGSGAYGKVWLVKWRSNNYAVKLFSRSGMSPGHIQGVIQEYTQTNKLFSDFVVPVQNLVVSPDDIGFMMKYVRGGTLHQAIHRPGASMPWDLRSSLAYQIARGCQFLYSCNPPVEHRDLKPANVLLQKGGTRCCISDFGQSKVHNAFKTETVSPVQGTVAYLAPELFQLRFRYSEKTDVWSYGVILWEMISGYVPLDQQTPSMIPSLICSGRAFPFTPDCIPSDAPPGLVHVAQACLSLDPSQRPTFDMVVSSLSGIVSDEFDD
ncbi:hypothetical protein KIPB_005874 [Kipferlia bialata]|uniref:Protein kinase domain-containing protein n=1 Tax=Kipferlia bialata TaxID=797122 RepID=A0A9K3GJ97_9EUKA|nr:hypothetical protein KIPB_005874 [Kipferlia bialata]|eukprot:g5874.t1